MCVFCRLYVALHHLTDAKPCGMALLYLTLGWTYTAHQRCNKSIPGCQNLSESFCSREQHIFRFPHLRADVCLTHRQIYKKKRVASYRSVCDFEGEWDRPINGVYVCLRVCFCVERPCLNGVFRVVNQRRGWGECQSVRLAPVKSPRALSLSVLTPLNLSLSSLTLTHSTSIDTGYPAALQRPEENPLQWLSMRGEPRSPQRRKDYIMRRDTERDASGFSGCLFFFVGFFSWRLWMDKREREKNTERMVDQHVEQICQPLDRKCWILTCIKV